MSVLLTRFKRINILLCHWTQTSFATYNIRDSNIFVTVSNSLSVEIAMKKAGVLLLAILVLAGCSSGLIRPKVEKGIKNSLSEYIGPAKKYKVKAEGSETSMMDGLIDHLNIEGEKVQLDKDLIVDNMIIDMDRVRYNPSSRKVKSVKSTTFKAILSENAVNSYISNNRKDDMDIKVKLEKGRVIANVSSKLIGVNVPVSVTGIPVIQNDNSICFQADSASVAHLPLPAFILNNALSRINPILDLSSMKFPVKVDSITVEKNSVHIFGSAEFIAEEN